VRYLTNFFTSLCWSRAGELPHYYGYTHAHTHTQLSHGLSIMGNSTGLWTRFPQPYVVLLDHIKRRN